MAQHELERVRQIALALPEVPDELAAADPERFFAPTPSASGVFSDWIGAYLDTEGELAVDWQEITAIIEDAMMAT